MTTAILVGHLQAKAFSLGEMFIACSCKRLLAPNGESILLIGDIIHGLSQSSFQGVGICYWQATITVPAPMREVVVVKRASCAAITDLDIAAIRGDV